MFSNLHIYKTNSILQVAATSVDMSDIKFFVEQHTGRDPTNPDQLSTLGATTALVICFHFLFVSHPVFKTKTRCSSYVCPGSSCHTYGQNIST
jgi:hypothetical protein